MRLLISFTFLLLATTQSFTQSINIDNTTRFTDGVYATFEDFVNNDPSYPLESCRIEWKETHYFNNLKMKSFKNYQMGKIKKTDMNKVWGVCVNGVPYIQYKISEPYRLRFGNKALDTNGKSSFTRIRILGNLCHFSIEDSYVKRTKNQYRSKVFNSDVDGPMIRAQRILKLSTGKVYEYDEYVLSQLIKDDELLAGQYKQESDRPYKMFVYLQKYNERNPVANTSILARQ